MKKITETPERINPPRSKYASFCPVELTAEQSRAVFQAVRERAGRPQAKFRRIAAKS